MYVIGYHVLRVCCAHARPLKKECAARMHIYSYNNNNTDHWWLGMVDPSKWLVSHSRPVHLKRGVTGGVDPSPSFLQS